MNNDQCPPNNSSFTFYEQIFFTLCCILGLFLRFYDLDLRPIHHDESLYGAYSYYFYLDPVRKFYTYNPLLHGPFLFNLFPWIFDTLGSTNAIVRVPSAFLGSLFVFLPILFKKFISKPNILFLTLAIALSPTLIYWSRYLRHDPFLLSSFLGILISLFIFDKKNKILGVSFFLALAFCIKENTYVLCAQILGYLIFEFVRHKGKSPIFSKMFDYIKNYYLQCFIALIIFSLTYCFFYTSGFRYSEGILDGLYRKSVTYWFDQHSIERLKGPFSFSFLFLSWYEQLFILITVFHYFYSFLYFPKVFRYSTIVTLIFSFIIYLIYKFYPNFQSFPLWTFLKLKIPLDVFLVLFFVSQSFILPLFHKSKKQNSLAFWSYLFYSSFFTYSYLGEKVPWLSLYILVPGMIYFSLYYNQFLEKIYCSFKKSHLIKIILCALFIVQLRYTIMINWGRVNNDSELIRQVHTTKEMEVFAKEVDKLSRLNPGLKVLTLNAPTWPLAWYFKDITHFRFTKTNKKNLPQYDFIFDEVNRKYKYRDLADNYDFKVFPFRSWWVPNYTELNFLNYIKYALSHTPWNPTGTMDILIMKKKNLRINF